jgi:hypothetical protein
MLPPTSLVGSNDGPTLAPASTQRALTTSEVASAPPPLGSWGGIIRPAPVTSLGGVGGAWQQAESASPTSHGVTAGAQPPRAKPEQRLERGGGEGGAGRVYRGGGYRGPLNAAKQPKPPPAPISGGDADGEVMVIEAVQPFSMMRRISPPGGAARAGEGKKGGVEQQQEEAVAIVRYWPAGDHVTVSIGTWDAPEIEQDEDGYDSFEDETDVFDGPAQPFAQVHIPVSSLNLTAPSSYQIPGSPSLFPKPYSPVIIPNPWVTKSLP